MLSKFQKTIYNLHLASYKKRQGKPYKFRENFEHFNVEHPEEYEWLLRLDKFFTNYSKINIKLFFNAPYTAYEDKDYYSLEYYTSQAAIKAYNTYLTLIKTLSPDSEFQVEFIKDSLKFIQEYCIEHKIKVTDYMFFKEGITFSWAVHVAERKTSFYAIIGFCAFNIPVYDKIYDMPEDERELLLSGMAECYPIYKDRLEQSKVAKRLILEGLKIIEKNVNDALQTK